MKITHNIKYYALLILLIFLNTAAILMAPLLLQVWLVDTNDYGWNKILTIVIILLCSMIMQFLIIKMKERFLISFNVKNALRLTKKTLSLDYEEYQKKGATYLIERISNAVNGVYLYFSDGLANIVVNSVIAVVLLGIAYYINAFYAVGLFLLIPFNYFAYNRLNKKLKDKSVSMQEICSFRWRNVIELSKDIELLKQLDSDQLLKQYQNEYNEIYKSVIQVNSYAQSVSAFLLSFNDMIKTLLLIILAFEVVNQRAATSSLIIFNMVIPLYTSAISSLVSSHLSKKDVAIFQEFENYLDDHDGKRVGEGAAPIETITLQNTLLHFNGNRIHISGDQSFQKGDVIAVEGASGAGKSVLMKHLSAFYRNDMFTLNQVSLDRYDASSLHKRIAYIPQTPLIYSDTIRNNLFLGRVERQDVLSKIKASGILDSILMNRALDSILFENGADLSGGEKQKIALCRFLFYDYDVLIADEICSNIDQKSAMELYELLVQNSKDKILFILSHDGLHQKYCNKHIYCEKEQETRIDWQ